jgi:hypothetical protein
MQQRPLKKGGWEGLILNDHCKISPTLTRRPSFSKRVNYKNRYIYVILILDPEIKKHFNPHQDLFDQAMSLHGEIFRELENRRTQRITLGGKNYFIKQHFGIGWKEIFKNLFQLRLPICSAKNEWLAIQKLTALTISTQKIVGYGSRGYNPACMQSFLITEELPPHTSLETLCATWKTQPPALRVKRGLIQAVARIARIMHSHGMNHRDFYLCHFLLASSQDPPNASTILYLIDLHRAQIRSKTPARWLIKDLAGLYFSSKDIGLTLRDLLRFIKEYRNQSLHEVFNKEPAFWQKVKQRGDKLYQQHAN